MRFEYLSLKVSKKKKKKLSLFPLFILFCVRLPMRVASVLKVTAESILMVERQERNKLAMAIFRKKDTFSFLTSATFLGRSGRKSAFANPS